MNARVANGVAPDGGAVKNRPRAIRWRAAAARTLLSPITSCLGLAAVAAVMTAQDWDVLARIAAFDARHEGWFVDEVVTTGALAAMLWTVRRTMQVTQEVKRRRKAEADADRLARHDPLTGLPNRRLLQETIDHLPQTLGRDGHAAVMIVDLDHFKSVNDVHGHAAGDALLQAFVARISGTLPKGTMLARLGGDEFAVVLQLLQDRHDAHDVAARIVDAASEPFQLGPSLLEIGASVGIAIVPADGSETSAILHAADLALYRAKQHGRGRWYFFEASLDIATREQAKLRSQLRTAITDGLIVPYYQPIIDLATGLVDGFEVLARWQHPIQGTLLPAAFVNLADDMGLMSRLTLAVLKRVIADAKAWPENYRIAFNMSARQFWDATGFAEITLLIANSGIDPARFEIEITEDVLFADAERVKAALTPLKDMGVTLALDNFGTGSCNLYHLRAIAFDKLKIENSFIAEMSTDARAARFVEAMVGFGRSLGLRVTAEGIEDRDVLRKLASIGCTLGQGYLFSRPLPAGDLSATLSRLGEAV